MEAESVSTNCLTFGPKEFETEDGDERGELRCFAFRKRKFVENSTTENQNSSSIDDKINPLCNNKTDPKTSDHNQLLSNRRSSKDTESNLVAREKKKKDMEILIVPLAAKSAGVESSNPKEYKCKVCGASFKTFRALGGHKSNHTVRIRREIVGYDHVSVERAKKKKTAIRKESGEVLQECDVCHKSFKTFRALKLHQRSHETHQSQKIVLKFDLNEPADNAED